jgi:hypothetical protein
MWQARIVLAGMCCICMTGCPDPKPAAPPASQTAPPIASGTTSPQTMSEAQIEATIHQDLSDLKNAITYDQCTNNRERYTNPMPYAVARTGLFRLVSRAV